MNQVRTATLLINHRARGVSRRVDADRVVRYLRKRGLRVTVVEPDSAEGATEAARASAARCDDLLFVVGGDGSLRDAALGVAGSETALAAVPAGTVNVWAKEAGIPGGIRGALDAHLAGQRVRVDLGRAGEHCFLLMASCGWDARVTREVSMPLKRRLGDLAYVLQAGLLLPRFRPVAARWWVDGVAHEGQLAIAVMSNTRLYGGVVRFAPGARADDGQLDVVAACPRSPLDTVRLAGRLALSRLHGDRCVQEARGREVVVETPGIPVQVDGDYLGETPMTFRVEPGALVVSLPGGPLPAVLSAAQRVG